MTHPDHLADDVFSALVDGQLSPDEVSLAQAHLGTCSICQARMDDTQAVVGLLRSLPTLEPPRDFRLGPRLVVDPPNVIRLRQWYAWTRAGAGALAAAFVFLSVGTLYVDSRPAATSALVSSKAQPAPQSAPAAQSAPAPAAQNAPGAAANDAAAPAAPPAPALAARPAAVPGASPPAQAPGVQAAAPALAPAPPAAAGAAARSQAAAAPTSTEPGDQIAAATTVRPLPTQVPTPTQIPQPATPFASAAPSLQPADPAAPLRVAAALVGVLAALGIFVALLVRHRLRAASPSHLE